MMERKSVEEISLFVRDERTGRFYFNAKALHAMGISPIQAQQCGYLLQEPPDAPDILLRRRDRPLHHGSAPSKNDTIADAVQLAFIAQGRA
jgi:hypothetical protein